MMKIHPRRLTAGFPKTREALVKQMNMIFLSKFYVFSSCEPAVNHFSREHGDRFEYLRLKSCKAWAIKVSAWLQHLKGKGNPGCDQGSWPLDFHGQSLM